MSETPKEEEKQLPTLDELKVIGYDLLMQSGALQAALRDTQRKLNIVNTDIRNHPDAKKGESNG